MCISRTQPLCLKDAPTHYLKDTPMTTTAPTMKFTDEQEDLLGHINEAYGSQFADYFNDGEGSESEAKLLSLLEEIGIENYDQFEDRYRGMWDMYDNTAKFAEEFYVDCMGVDVDSPVFFAIDWDVVWNCNLRHEMDVVEDVYFFSSY